MPKVDKIEYEKRIRAVQEWIIEDWPYSDIVSSIISKWQISIPQAKRYIAEGRRRWTENEKVLIDHMRKLKIESLKKLKRSLKEQYKGSPIGIRAILEVEKEIIKLQGLNPAIKHELYGKDGAPLNLPVPQINVYNSGPPLASSESEIEQ